MIEDRDGAFGGDVEPEASLALRTDLMLAAPETLVTRLPECLVVRTPENPTFWWGNFLYFGAPPQAGDSTRWEALFNQQIRAAQPGSRHTAFSWPGHERGEVGPFEDRGYEVLDSIVMSARTLEPYRHANSAAQFRKLREDEWGKLLELMVAEREAGHPLEDYTNFALRRVERWRTRVAQGRGAWFGAFMGDLLASSLGIFVGREAQSDGTRLARFQEVVTARAHRQKGLAGTLIGQACAMTESTWGPLQLVIVADANDVAQRLYRSLGFRVVEHYKGLEKGGY
ncbi:MAG: GNAT family N-acetyltransferase [Burkholderiaceae bacterium]|jgi:ribosomal protein S18 acetylase RimI-like enzyme